MKQKIFFRADAGQEIGYGHFIRSLALADILKEDFDCTFFTQTPSDYQKKEAHGVCPLVELPSDDSKFNQFLDYLSGEEIVVLDNYFFTTEYQRQVKNKGCKLVCIDDIHDKHYVADVVINHGVSNNTFFDSETYTKLCLGFSWALLRRPFLENIRISNRKKDSWLISFGGSDYYNLTEKYVKLLIEKGNTDINVIVGDSYQYHEELKTYSKLKVHKNISAVQMAEVMQNCENAILPTSGICLEALSQGCNIYGGYYIDNQREIYNYLLNERAIYPLGDLTMIDDINVSEGRNTIVSIRSSMNDIRLRYQLLFRSFVPPIVINDFTFIDYTRLPLSDHHEVLNIRNSWEIRKNMDSLEVIPWESHCEFIESLIKNSGKKYWAIYNNDEFVASVNIVYVTDSIVERGIFISPKQFGKAMGSKIENATIELLKMLSIESVEAKVLHTNNISLKFHYKNHYENVNGDDKYCYFRRNIK